MSSSDLTHPESSLGEPSSSSCSSVCASTTNGRVDVRWKARSDSASEFHATRSSSQEELEAIHCAYQAPAFVEAMPKTVMSASMPLERTLFLQVIQIDEKSSTVAGVLPNAQMVGFVAGKCIVAPAGRPVLFEFQLEDGYGMRSYYCLIRHGKAILVFTRWATRGEIRILDGSDKHVMTAYGTASGFVLKDTIGAKIAMLNNNKLEWGPELKEVTSAEPAQLFAITMILNALTKSSSAKLKKKCALM